MDGELDYEAEGVECEENSSHSQADDSEEDGQCDSEKEEKAESLEEGEDDGEISDDADFEEGELVENNSQTKQSTKQVCKFFIKGLCTWGTQCRFLHVNSNGKGCYNMFDLPPRIPPFFQRPVMPPPNIIPRMMNFRPRHPLPHFLPMPPHFPPFMPLPPRLPASMPPPIEDEEEDEDDIPGAENDWEATLQETKALVQKASKKNDNFSVRSHDYNKENHYKSYRRRSKTFRYEEVYAAYNSSNNNNEISNNWSEDQFSKKHRNQRVYKSYDRHERQDFRREDRARSDSFTSFSSFSFSDRSSRSRTHSPSRKSNASKRTRSRSFSKSRSSHSRSRSHSMSRTPSRSRSRSLSMDSVSSASSHVASSLPNKFKIDTKPPITSSLGEELLKTRIKIKEEPLDEPEPEVPENPPEAKPLPRLHHLLPLDDEEPKPAAKPVKFTFLKKSSKKILDISKSNIIDDDLKTHEKKGTKRQISDNDSATRAKIGNSRREELLKQLQAVEDAIARKRGKV